MKSFKEFRQVSINEAMAPTEFFYGNNVYRELEKTIVSVLAKIVGSQFKFKVKVGASSRGLTITSDLIDIPGGQVFLNIEGDRAEKDEWYIPLTLQYVLGRNGQSHFVEIGSVYVETDGKESRFFSTL